MGAQHTTNSDQFAAAPEPQYQQLTMFHTARELRGGSVGKFLPSDKESIDEGYDPDTGDFHEIRKETDEEAWERKSVESDMIGLTEHIKEHGGVERPVDLALGDPLLGRETGTIMNGMHRVAAQHDVNPDALMPVSWTNRMYPGSEGRTHFHGQITEPVVGPKWDREEEQAIGYKRRGWDD
jgi:hypothetical protein